MTRPVVALRSAHISFGGHPLVVAADLAVARGDRVCLVGRNGAGKSTLLKLLGGLTDLDGGERWTAPGLRIAYLPQEPELRPGETVAAHVAAGLGPAVSTDDHRVKAMLDRVALTPERTVADLSGGEVRRASVARALVGEPELLLLDEPTNHLDLPTIERLEEELTSFAGALVVVSHDRAFLARLTTRTWWLDRGEVRQVDRGFAEFEGWAETVLAAEEEEARRLDRKIVAETRWLQRGVTARRRRNEGRRRRLAELRRARAERIGPIGRARMATGRAEAGGRLVIEADGIAKRFDGAAGETVIVRDFSTRILRGDRIGIVGPNGAGKTTLLRMLLGEVEPDRGRVRHGANLKPLVHDQRREALDPDLTLWRTLAPGGGDSLSVRGETRHVVAYLRDFLFDESQALQPVRSLSGGERSRLLLARLFARPANLLALDEPTNDLDLETLDLLEDVLGDYDGTVLVISHDRDFLDRVATSIIAVEGGGEVREYVGGYGDYLRQRPPPPAVATPHPKARVKAARPRPSRTALSFRERQELERLTALLGTLGEEIMALERLLAEPNLYGRDRRRFEGSVARLAAAKAELEAAEARWLELEQRRDGSSERV